MEDIGEDIMPDLSGRIRRADDGNRFRGKIASRLFMIFCSSHSFIHRATANRSIKKFAGLFHHSSGAARRRPGQKTDAGRIIRQRQAGVKQKLPKIPVAAPGKAGNMIQRVNVFVRSPRPDWPRFYR